MSNQTERLEFITRFRDAFPDRTRLDCIAGARAFMRLAATHGRLAMEECNNGPSVRLEVRQARLNARILKLVVAWGLRVDLRGDPRGYAVRVHFPDGASNTLGGRESGYGVPQ